ncbi:nicotinate-nucleotide--dimethylbenzimidazole phosphoribosyltransferase [Streptomyces sp. NPDC057554]|uniref:nicotinate-nucleotide--dimethylbenzimidazole phosphoribosyltransferase n=1 Tax=Streptomyces sp. NPDC057554 TaxID=3350538 RepID=UPI00369E90D7
MTDTGQVPGEGLPENAGMVEQPGIPAPDAYTFLDPSEHAPEDDDLLLMPASQGAWSDPQTVQTQAAPAPAPAAQAPVPAAAPAPGPVPASAPAPEQAAPQLQAQQPEPQGQAQYAAQPQVPAQSQEAVQAPGAAHGTHESGGRDTGSVDLNGVRIPAPAPAPVQAPAPVGAHAAAPAPARRPLHRGPASAEAPSYGGGTQGGGVVRSLADRGPAGAVRTAPPVRHAGPPSTTGPEYFDAPSPEAPVLPGPQLGEIPPQGAAMWGAPPQPPQPEPEVTAAPASASEPSVQAEEVAEGEVAVTPEAVEQPEQAAVPREPVQAEAAGEPGAAAEPEQAVEAPEQQPAEAVETSEVAAEPEAVVPEVAAPVAVAPVEAAEAEAAPVEAETSQPEVVPVEAAAPQPEAAPVEAAPVPVEPVAPAPEPVEQTAPAETVAPEPVAVPQPEVSQPQPEAPAEAVAPEPVPVPVQVPAQDEEPAEPLAVAPAEQPAEEPVAAPEVVADAPAEPGAQFVPVEPQAPEPEAPVQQTPVAEPEPVSDPVQPVEAAETPETVETAPAPTAPEVAVAAAEAPEPAATAEPEPQPEPEAAAEPVVAPVAPEPVQLPAESEPVAVTEPATVTDATETTDPDDGTGPEVIETPELDEQPAADAAPAEPFTPPAPGYDDAEREAVLRVMRERRDIRNGFRSDPIPHEVLLRVLEAAHTAPSVGHSQPWDFVVIRSAETRRSMHELAQRQRDAYAKSLPKGRAKQFKELKIEAILDTPVNIVVTADPTRGGRHTLGRHTQPQMAPYSSALAVENLWLAARAEGLGVGWVSFFDEREMVRALGLPEHLEVVAYLCVGYVDEFPEEPELLQAGWSKRRPLSWVVHEETYGRRALPGEEPHDLLQETISAIRPLDAKALGEAWERQKRMTKPAGALGMLEIISAQLSGLSRMCPPPIPEPAAVAIFAGDHGVHAQGVTAWPQEVTAQMVANFLGGGAVCNAFAAQVGAEVCVVDVGVASDLPATPGLLPRKVRKGTADFTTGPALTREDVLAAIEVGIETARDLVAAGNKALLTGEMGIANTTASAALICVYTGIDASEVTGRGTGINDEMHARKVDVVRRALDLHQPDPADPIGVLAAVGGLEHAAMVGFLLGGASLRTPVVLDGVSAGAAALVARAIAPEALAACIAGHRSAEPGHVAALNKLGLRPLVDLDLRLGEGTGALLALPIVQSAARAMHEVATFDAAGVTEK